MQAAQLGLQHGQQRSHSKVFQCSGNALQVGLAQAAAQPLPDHVLEQVPELSNMCP